MPKIRVAMHMLIPIPGPVAAALLLQKLTVVMGAIQMLTHERWHQAAPVRLLQAPQQTVVAAAMVRLPAGPAVMVLPALWLSALAQILPLPAHWLSAVTAVNHIQVQAGPVVMLLQTRELKTAATLQ
jgi:hypothetical protein